MATNMFGGDTPKNPLGNDTPSEEHLSRMTPAQFRAALEEQTGKRIPIENYKSTGEINEAELNVIKSAAQTIVTAFLAGIVGDQESKEKSELMFALVMSSLPVHLHVAFIGYMAAGVVGSLPPQEFMGDD